MLGYSNSSAKNSGNYENEYIPQNNSRRQNQPSTPGTPSNAIVMDIPIHDQPQQFGRVRRSNLIIIF